MGCACGHGVPEDRSLDPVVADLLAVGDAGCCAERLAAAEPLVAAARAGLDPRARAQARALTVVAELLAAGDRDAALVHIRELERALPVVGAR